MRLAPVLIFSISPLSQHHENMCMLLRWPMNSADENRGVSNGAHESSHPDEKGLRSSAIRQMGGADFADPLPQRGALGCLTGIRGSDRL